MSFTPGQQRAYRELLARAHHAAGGSWTLDEFKRHVLKGAVGVESSRDCNHVEHYDAVMLDLATIAGDEALMAKFAAGGEQRLLHVLADKRRAFEQMRGAPVADNYLLAMVPDIVGRQNRALNDLPETALWRIIQGLDANLRSLRRKAARQAA